MAGRFACRDIFEYPQIRRSAHSKSLKPQLFESTLLRRPSEIAKPVLITGKTYSGKTTLLKSLYEDYLGSGVVPVLLDGTEIARASDLEVRKTVDRAVSNQYGQDAIERFKQLAKNERVLLIDNVDRIAIKNSAARAKAIGILLSEFGGVIATALPEFAFEERLDQLSTSGALFRPYSLEPFRAVMRSRLAQRWMRMRSDESLSDEDTLARVDAAERLLAEVMKRGVVPSYPIYLLALLQSLVQNKQDELRGAGLGYYYQYLMTEALLAGGVHRDKLNELVPYLAHMAWYMKQKGTRTLTEAQLAQFNAAYSEIWFSTDLRSRKGELLKSGLCVQTPDGFAFKYDYIFFLMKANYMSDALTADDDVARRDEVREHIERCAQHIYLHDNANTLLFLSHYTINGGLVEALVRNVNEAFKNVAAITFGEDLSAIEEFIQDAPKLVLPSLDVEANRERVNLNRDSNELAAENQQPIAAEVDGDLPDNLTLLRLFQGSEVLGQLLKGQYPRLGNRRHVVIETLFDAPMRAIGVIYQFLLKRPPVVVNAMKAVKSTDSESAAQSDADKKLRRSLLNLTEILTALCLGVAADSVRKEELIGEVNAIVRARNTNSYHLMGIALLLDRQSDLPRNELEELRERFAGNLIATRLLTILLVKRLFEYKTSWEDLQWAVGKFGLSSNTSRQVTALSSREDVIEAQDVRALPQ